MNQPGRLYATNRHQNGFTLLEVLIAVVVLSLGLLGAAALQIKGLQSAHSAYQRTVASIIATDAAERLWLDLHNGAINVEAVEDAWLAHWAPSNETSKVSLPGFQGQIDPKDASDPVLFTISVSWAEGRFEDADGLAGRSEFVYHTRIFPPR